MALSTTVYTLNTYTPATYTELVPSADVFVTASLVLANTAGTDATVTVRLAQGGTESAIILPPFLIVAGESHTLALRSLNVPDGYTLDISVDIVGVHATASGVIDV
jgi:hypothetical protein